MKEINTDKWGIIGHKNVVSYFKISLERHKFAHTYLFSGPAQVGKKTVVNKFIQSLICDNYLADNDVSAPCEKCPSCQQWIKNIHPDYYELEFRG